MAVGASLQMFHEVGVVRTFGPTTEFKSSKMRHCHQLPSISLSSCASRQDVWSLHLADRIYKPMLYVTYRYNTSICRSFSFPHSLNEIPLKTTTLALTRSCNALLANPAVPQLISAVGIIAFAVWGLLPFMRNFRKLFHKDSNWKKSKTHYVSTSCLQPLLLWTGTMLICRAFDPIVLSSEASQVVKLRLLNFVKSLSTVLAFAYCLSSLIQKTQNFFMESDASNDTRKMGFQFAGRALYTVVWIAAVSLFMELLGFSTQKWITAGGLGTVLLTLAGREIFTNFLSSVMIHATRPFVVNQWIQTKIEGYEVSGTVEHVGWWSPTIIRGEDREAVHIPNHKFTVNVVRNLTQKTHWRIKTHLAISHLDVNKINNVVADMRKVLAKNSQIEQQRLHRRVFLENINLENQALLVLVSCFVKTSHFEEYLCVKEAILLDLLRVIRHHGARLATPIRTIQKTYGGTYMNTPYAETAFTRANAATDHPFYLIEAPPRTNGEDKAKARNTSRGTEEQTAKSAASSDAKVTSSNGTSSKISDKEQQNNMSSGDGWSKSSKLDPVVASSSDSPSSSKVEPSDLAGSVSRAGDGKPSASESVNEKADDTIPPAHAKNGAERVAQPPGTKPAFEDNIVLGVALEGSKRTLPIEVGMGPGPHLSDANEHDKKGPSPSKKDNKGSTLSSSSQLKLDQRDQEW